MVHFVDLRSVGGVGTVVKELFFGLGIAAKSEEEPAKFKPNL